MAAGGYKEFIAGSILEEDDINDYLMQGVLVFAGTAARGSAITSPVEGQFSFLKDSDTVQFFDGSAWVSLESGTPYATITGTTGSPTITSGTVIGGESFDIYTFTGNGSIIVGEAGLIDIHCLAGGGSGGAGVSGNPSGNEGGGGGGGYFELTRIITSGTATITVGGGGAGATTTSGIAGADSSVGSFGVARGGAGGCRHQSTVLPGGNGGGGSNVNGQNIGSAGLTLGNIHFGLSGGNGGTTFGGNDGAGGGGGSNEAGGTGNLSVGGKGGDGKATSITGTSVTRGGGGGGSRRSGSGGAGGAGGGTAGASSGGTSTAASANTGGGSGGAGGGSGAGGSGIVIVRVKV